MECNQRLALLNKIRSLEFATLDLHLYLNSHPYDMRALSAFNCYMQQLPMLRRQYAQLYDPITLQEAGNKYPWSWINDPWPWEQDIVREEESNVGL